MARIITFFIAAAIAFAAVLFVRGVYKGYEPLADVLISEAKTRRILLFGELLSPTPLPPVTSTSARFPKC